MRFRFARFNGQLVNCLLSSDGPFNTPIEAHRQNIATALGVSINQIEMSESDQAPDLSGGLPLPVTPLSADDQERLDANGLKLPNFTQIDNLIDTVFADHSVQQRTFMKRICKLIKVAFR